MLRGIFFISVLLVSAALGQSPTSGPSWLEHLHRNMSSTSMGRSSWQLGPAPGGSASPIQVGPFPSTVTLTGADLYRIKCQGCHGTSGEGAPPEINSIINPVRATSASVIMERMKKTGAPISRKDAATLAKQSETALLARLHKGGMDMPHPALRENEIRVLLPYLQQLAGVASKQLSLHESTLQVGEHVVKSTCHICHSAVGPNPSPAEIASGVIPPLSTLTARTSLEQFVRKVTRGAPVTMGDLSIPARGRMPVFSYLKESEAAAAYIYLLAYPPSTETPSVAEHSHR
jgi:mono/diheme cytochrome c family protein